MKKQKNIIITLLVLAIINIVSMSRVYADPNSSKGFAEYDDTQAEEEAQEMLQEQQKEIENNAGKSSNNYLDNLRIEGYEISPKFDKQTIEYTVKGTIKESEINIIATPSDNKATIQGAGKVKVQGNDQFRIDVIAESGTVRTYTIYLNGQTNQAQQNEEEMKTEEQFREDDATEESNVEKEELESTLETENGKIDNTNSSTSEKTINIVWIIIAIFAVIIIIIAIWKRKK